ncbi:MAG: sugar phosphate nucleotidyltransferase [Candidatus Bathyarchaeia archaeon]
MKTVILSAGRGERLSPLTYGLPKPLITIHGTPLIEYILRAFMDAGLKEFIIVTGYKGSVLRNHLRRGILGAEISFVNNRDYSCGNATSLLCAREALAGEEWFFIAMSDHIIERSLVEAALRGFQGEPLLCVDRAPRYLRDIREATKVLVDENGYVRDI